MPEPTTEGQLEEFLEIRKPGAHLEEGVVADDFVLMLGVDLNNYPKFPRVDDAVTYPRATSTSASSSTSTRVPSWPITAARTGPICASPTSRRRRWPPSSFHGASCTCSSASTGGPTRSRTATAPRPWPKSSGPPGTTRSRRNCARMRSEFLPADTAYEDPNQHVRPEDRASTRVVYTGLFSPGPNLAELGKEQLVTWFLGGHEYLLQCIEGWAAQIVVRYGLDVMFDMQYTLWGNSVLPGVKKLKEEMLGITGNTVADWMKDLQLDATALPGKAFDLTFEMPEPDVGVMTFNRCVAVDQWETMGRPDILEKNCHSTCPKSMIVTTKMYNPNMKVDILAIPPRREPGDVCCKWQFSMRTEDDPEYVPVEISKKP